MKGDHSMSTRETVTVYIHDGIVTIDFPKNKVPDADTIHRIWEAIQDAKKKSPAGEQTGEGQSIN